MAEALDVISLGVALTDDGLRSGRSPWHDGTISAIQLSTDPDRCGVERLSPRRPGIP